LVLGAAGGLALGYTLDHFLGDSDYSGKEAFVDATTGALGGGLVNPVIRVGSRANKVIRHSGRQVYKVGAGATESLLVAGYVTKPMISRPVRMELLAGAAAGLVYDIATQSSGSSSEQNGTHVGPGGNTPGVYEPRTGHETSNGVIVKHSCKPRFVPRWHRHKDGRITAVCVPLKYARKKITYEI
jgi:hypothetical protein